MALPFEELEAITNDYFMLQGGKAVDIYFKTSYLLTCLMKEKKGLWERPPGGPKIRIPLEYDGQESGFYGRGDTISSDERESLNAAYFDWKHCYANATVLRVDELENSGEYAQVQYVAAKVAGAQKSLTQTLASSIYDAAGGSSNRLTGLRACCNETATTTYGGIAEDDLVANDGDKPWEGKMDANSTSLDLNWLRTGASAAKIRDGENGKPDLVVTTETNWNVISDLLQAQQRFTKDSPSAKAGFTGIWFEGKDIFADDYCPASHGFFLNKTHIGFAVHKNGYYVRSRWRVIPDSADDRSMKLYWDGNMVVDNRKGHQGYSSVS